jgi:hypothetical protein
MNGVFYPNKLQTAKGPVMDLLIGFSFKKTPRSLIISRCGLDSNFSFINDLVVLK